MIRSSLLNPLLPSLHRNVLWESLTLKMAERESQLVVVLSLAHIRLHPANPATKCKMLPRAGPPPRSVQDSTKRTNDRRRFSTRNWRTTTRSWTSRCCSWVTHLTPQIYRYGIDTFYVQAALFSMVALTFLKMEESKLLLLTWDNRQGGY